jgi:hypothetical protein
MKFRKRLPWFSAIIKRPTCGNLVYNNIRVFDVTIPETEGVFHEQAFE